MSIEGNPRQAHHNAVPAVVAFVHASEPVTGAGGNVTVPAAGVSVAPKAGRLILIETALEDGSCDPASAIAVTPLASSSPDLLLFHKTFYTTRAFSRAAGNFEGPRRLSAFVECKPEGAFGCRRVDHEPSTSGDAIIPLRDFGRSRKCLPPGVAGACLPD